MEMYTSSATSWQKGPTWLAPTKRLRQRFISRAAVWFLVALGLCCLRLHFVFHLV
jgi:hypothetical protein